MTTRFDALSMLKQMLRAHGIETVEHDGWLISPGDVRGWTVNFIKPQGVHDYVWQLDASVAPKGGRLLVESCAAVGATPEAAGRNGFDKFARSAFHVLLSAFCDNPQYSQVQVEEWQDANGSFRALVGPALLTGQVPPSTMTARLEVIRDAFLAEAMPHRPHWLRVFAAKSGQGRMTLEILRDIDSSSSFCQAFLSPSLPICRNPSLFRSDSSGCFKPLNRFLTSQISTSFTN